MKSSLIALSLAITATFTANAAVTYHTPSLQMETNLNAYGAGVNNWEEVRLTQLTMADSHLHHHHAVISVNKEKQWILKLSVD